MRQVVRSLDEQNENISLDARLCGPTPLRTNSLLVSLAVMAFKMMRRLGGSRTGAVVP
jgi:hypothetical protein